MDPSQTLCDAAAHLRAEESAAAAAALANYWAWRRGGGFEPLDGDQLAAELERRLAASVAAGGPAQTYRSCSWCHTLNAATERYCTECGHEAHGTRRECRCPRCGRSPAPITAQDVEAVLAALRRRQDQAGTTGGDPHDPF